MASTSENPVLQARPEPFSLRPDRCAIVVNDMQNAFCSPGGYLERIGFDISGARQVVEAVGRVFDSARSAGIPIFHFTISAEFAAALSPP